MLFFKKKNEALNSDMGDLPKPPIKNNLIKLKIKAIPRNMKPENDVEQLKLKVDALRAKIDTNEAVMDKVLEEIKNVRNMNNFVSREEFSLIKEEVSRVAEASNFPEDFKKRLGELVSRKEVEVLRSELENIEGRLNEVKKQPESKQQNGNEILNKCNKKISDAEALIRKRKLDEGISAYRQLSLFYNELLQTDASLNEKNRIYSKINELHKILTQ